MVLSLKSIYQVELIDNSNLCYYLILAGGLFTGAELLKTQEQYEAYGGLVNAPLDPCYHKVSIYTRARPWNPVFTLLLYFIIVVL